APLVGAAAGTQPYIQVCPQDDTQLVGRPLLISRHESGKGLNRMPLRLMVSQGRIDDRSPNAVLGAALTAEALAKRLGIDPKVIGRPSPHKVDDWRKSLPAAEA